MGTGGGSSGLSAGKNRHQFEAIEGGGGKQKPPASEMYDYSTFVWDADRIEKAFGDTQANKNKFYPQNYQRRLMSIVNRIDALDKTITQELAKPEFGVYSDTTVLYQQRRRIRQLRRQVLEHGRKEL